MLRVNLSTPERCGAVVAAGGDLLLAAAQEQVLRLLILTGLIGIFSVHASAGQTAAAAGGSSRAPAPVAGRSVISV